MGDMGEFYNGLRDERRERRAKFGVPCPGCIKDHPKREPTILLPQQRCKVCGHRDPRPRLDAPTQPRPADAADDTEGK